MASKKKKDLSHVTNEEALAHLEELFCKTCATGEFLLSFFYAHGKNHNLFYVQNDTTNIFLLLEDIGKEAPSAQDQVIDAVDSWNTGQSRIEMASDLMSHINISSDTVALLDPETVLMTTCIFLSAATNHYRDF